MNLTRIVIDKIIEDITYNDSEYLNEKLIQYKIESKQLFIYNKGVYGNFDLIIGKDKNDCIEKLIRTKPNSYFNHILIMQRHDMTHCFVCNQDICTIHEIHEEGYEHLSKHSKEELINILKTRIDYEFRDINFIS